MQVDKSAFDTEAEKNQLKMCTGDPDDMMTATFAARRHTIVLENASVAELKESYPQLFTEHQASFSLQLFFTNFCGVCIFLRTVSLWVWGVEGCVCVCLLTFASNMCLYKTFMTDVKWQ